MKNWFVVLSTLLVVFSGATAYAQALGATTNPVSGTYAYVSGSPLTFTVTASGGTGPYSYKWAKDGTSSYLPGETASTLTIDPVATGNAGTYYAVVTTAPATPDFQWITSSGVTKKITYKPYQVTLAVGTWLLGPLPKEVVNTSAVVTFEKPSTGDTTVGKPFVVIP